MVERRKHKHNVTLELVFALILSRALPTPAVLAKVALIVKKIFPALPALPTLTADLSMEVKSLTKLSVILHLEYVVLALTISTVPAPPETIAKLTVAA